MRVAATTVLIDGRSGAGKTTLVSLIPRLHDATSGQVLLDGVPVTDLARADISAAVGLVPQKPYLFSGTIAHNLRFGDPSADEKQLWDALEVAQGAGFVADATSQRTFEENGEPLPLTRFHLPLRTSA